MSNKSIGIRKEWSLKTKLQNDGYLVMRSSASKTGIDILAGKPSAEGGHELLAFQVQTSEYIYPEKVADLEKYARAFGAQPFVALTRERKWHFVKPDELEKSGKMWKVRLVAEEKNTQSDGGVQQ
ncbi:MAG: hypothetical protein WA139_05020 [Candidatus Aenigmatarchaeota archaeon]